MTEPPEINLARRLAEKYCLKPPIDIDELAKRYARVVVTFLPAGLDVDGATFDLKRSRKRPTIVVNENRPRSRRRFTTAHELGHVLIPWHIGPILDELVLTDGKLGTPYWELESEANRFASEILMPTPWITEVVKTLESPSASLEQIVNAADVSAFAAVIALNNNLPEGYVYARLNDEGYVASSGRSEGTLANVPAQGSHIDQNAIYPVSDEKWHSKQADGLYVWWHLPSEAALPRAVDQRGWREILEEMLEDIRVPKEEIGKFKQSVNGVFGSANGRATARTAESIYSAAMQRFHSHAQHTITFRRLVDHKKFASYLRSRIEDVLNKL